MYTRESNFINIETTYFEQVRINRTSNFSFI